MKTFTFLLLALFATFSLNAQVVIINSPTSLEGGYAWENSTNWGANLTIDVWTGDCILVTDGSALPTEGCGAPINDVAGKIVLIDRGTCEFGEKALNAEQAGAMAVVILNNVPGGPIPMGDGDVGGQVTIPTIMLSMEDGALIKAAIGNDVVVNMTIGALQFDNDISINAEGVTVPPLGTVPANQITSPGGVAAFTPGTLIRNDGALNARNILSETTIDFTPIGGTTTQVYSESAAAGLIPADTGTVFIAMPTPFDYNGSEPGVYNITYNTGFEQTDELSFNNEFIVDFAVSENVFSKARWDFENNRPAFTNSVTIAGGGPVELLSPFNIPFGVGNSIDSIKFHVSTDLDSLGGTSIAINLYKWDDLNADTTITNDELQLVGLNSHTFDPSFSESRSWITASILEANDLLKGYPIPEDGGNYLVGTRYDGPDLLFFGFDNRFTQEQNFDQGLLFRDMDLSHLVTNDFLGQFPDFDGENVGAFAGINASALAMYVNPVAVVSTKEVLTDADAKLHLFPNPVSNVLNAEVTLKEQTKHLQYRITDINGKLIFSAKKADVIRDLSTFNINQLPTGQYNFSIQTDKGIKTEKFTVQR